MKIATIIPARAGSKRIPDKNMKEVQGLSLMAWAIGVSKIVDPSIPVFVDTDSPRYAEEASNYGATVPFLRDARLATDSSTDFETIQAFCATLDFPEDTIILHLRPTTPLRDPNIVRKAMEVFTGNAGSFSALRSVHENPTVPYKAFEMRPNNQLAPIKGITKSVADANRPSQSFPKTYIGNGYVDFFRVSNLWEHRSVHGPKVFGFLTDFAVDVDSEDDLREILLSSNKESHRLTARKISLLSSQR